jgi:hypothetical protein
MPVATHRSGDRKRGITHTIEDLTADEKTVRFARESVGSLPVILLV